MIRTSKLIPSILNIDTLKNNINKKFARNCFSSTGDTTLTQSTGNSVRSSSTTSSISFSATVALSDDYDDVSTISGELIEPAQRLITNSNLFDKYDYRRKLINVRGANVETNKEGQ